MYAASYRLLLSVSLSLPFGIYSSTAIRADDYPMVGTWTVDFRQTAETLGSEDKAKGFLSASQGIQIEMVYRPDGTVVFTRKFGQESESFAGKYEITKRDDSGLVIEVMTPRKGISGQEIYQSPETFINEQVLMRGTFREHYPDSESFGLAQGEFVIEVFYENLNEAQKKSIASQKQGGEAPVAVAGTLGQSTIEDDEVYFLEAKGIVWDTDVMGKDQIRVKLIDQDHCKMAAPGLGMPFIWKRVH
jgi:hypothetical protein